MQVVQTPTPRRFEYAGDLASGSPQAAAAYARQVSSGTAMASSCSFSKCLQESGLK